MGLARQLAHQPQRLFAEARLGDEVEVGAGHVSGAGIWGLSARKRVLEPWPGRALAPGPRPQFPALSISHWLSRPTGRPVAMPRLPSPLAVPATSRCAQRWPSVKRDRKQPAVTAPAQRPPML